MTHDCLLMDLYTPYLSAKFESYNFQDKGVTAVGETPSTVGSRPKGQGFTELMDPSHSKRTLMVLYVLFVRL